LTDILASAIALAGLQPVTGGRDRGVQRRGEAGQLLEVGQKRAPSQDIVDRVAVHSGRAGTFWPEATAGPFSRHTQVNLFADFGIAWDHARQTRESAAGAGIGLTWYHDYFTLSGTVAMPLVTDGPLGLDRDAIVQVRLDAKTWWGGWRRVRARTPHFSVGLGTTNAVSEFVRVWVLTQPATCSGLPVSIVHGNQGAHDCHTAMN
jgi:hypothetical protein